MAILLTTGTITTATGNVAASLNGDPQVFVAVYGTYTGVSFLFEGSVDGTNWFKIQAFRSDTYQAESFTSGSLTLPNSATRGWFLMAGAFTQVRVRATALSTGTVNVVIQEGPTKGSPVLQPLAQGIQYYMPAGKQTVAFATGNAGATPLVTGAGILDRVSVTTTGTVSTVFYDNATLASGTQLFASPASYTLGTVTEVKMPFANGITLNQVTGVAAGTVSYILF